MQSISSTVPGAGCLGYTFGGLVCEKFWLCLLVGGRSVEWRICWGRVEGLMWEGGLVELLDFRTVSGWRG